ATGCAQALTKSTAPAPARALTALRTPDPTADPTDRAPILTSISSSFLLPVSTYSATATDPDGDSLDFTWEMVGEACGFPEVPWKQSGPSVRWNHRDCNHDEDPDPSHVGPDGRRLVLSHPEVITLRVSDGRGGKVTCIFQDVFHPDRTTYSFPLSECHPSH